LVAKLSKKLRRPIDLHALDGDAGPTIVRLANDAQYDLVIISMSPEFAYSQATLPEWVRFILRHAPCRVFLAGSPAIPSELVEGPSCGENARNGPKAKGVKP
jgi:nucleotide-binding universal stress UspA family protein